MVSPFAAAGAQGRAGGEEERGDPEQFPPSTAGSNPGREGGGGPERFVSHSPLLSGWSILVSPRAPPLVPFWILSSFITQQLLRSNRRWGRSHSSTPGSETQSAGVQCRASQVRGCAGSRRNKRQTGADVLTEPTTLTSPGPPANQPSERVLCAGEEDQIAQL